MPPGMGFREFFTAYGRRDGEEDLARDATVVGLAQKAGTIWNARQLDWGRCKGHSQLSSHRWPLKELVIP